MYDDILIIDDNPANIRLLSSILDQQDYLVRGAVNPKMGLNVIREDPPDLILLDINMPQMDGFEVCRQLKADEHTRDIPIIFVSALDRTSDIVNAFHVGAVDYITKPFQADEVLARVRTQCDLRALQRDLQSQVKAQTVELRRRNEDLEILNRVITASAAARHMPEVLQIICDSLSQAFSLPYAVGVLRNDEAGEIAAVVKYHRNDQPMIPFSLPIDTPIIQNILNAPRPIAVRNYREHDYFAPLHLIFRQQEVESLLIVPTIVDETPLGAVILFSWEPRDFLPHEINLAQSVANQASGALKRIQIEAERKQLEQEYYQVQKMEAIGQLTGGIAHDFNNLLTVSNGFAELSLRHIDADHPAHAMINQVIYAGERAAELVRRLLIFSRKQIVQPEIVNLNDIIRDMMKMLQRIIGQNVSVKANLSNDIDVINADASQLGQIIMNLSVNARDAMPDGGQVEITTDNADFAQPTLLKGGELSPGKYVILCVADNGTGIAPAVQNKIFEPFFTTKEKGKGTGLGLSTVFGIVKQAGGAIDLESRLGKGTTFKIYFPSASETALLETDDAHDKKSLTGGDETILVVEDETEIRGLIVQVLQHSGYDVLQSTNAESAQKQYEQYAGKISLLLSDVIMPDVSGGALAEKLQQHQSDLKVLLMSGYSTERLLAKGVLVNTKLPLLQKPFNATMLLKTVRSVLDS